MPYRFHLPGYGNVECDTYEELQKAAERNHGQITGVSLAEPRRAGRPRKLGAKRGNGKSSGSGPARSWALAQWYGLTHNMTPNEARPALAKIKAEQAKKFLEIKEEFEKFAKAYGAKIKKDSLDEIAGALRTLYLDDQDAYKKVFDEYSKRTSKK